MSIKNKKNNDLNSNTILTNKDIQNNNQYIELIDKSENSEISLAENNSSKNKTPLKYGNYKILTYDKNGDPFLVVGPDISFFFGLLSFNIVILVIFFFIFYCYCSFLKQLIGFTLSFLQIFFFVFCSLKNPGLPKKKYQSNYLLNSNCVNYKKCFDCNLIIDLDKKFSHCITCNCCCEGYDHHCVWTTKCVGKGNIIYFRLMIISVLVLMVYFSIVGTSINPYLNKCKFTLFK